MHHPRRAKSPFTAAPLQKIPSTSTLLLRDTILAACSQSQDAWIQARLLMCPTRQSTTARAATPCMAVLIRARLTTTRAPLSHRTASWRSKAAPTRSPIILPRTSTCQIVPRAFSSCLWMGACFPAHQTSIRLPRATTARAWCFHRHLCHRHLRHRPRLHPHPYHRRRCHRHRSCQLPLRLHHGRHLIHRLYHHQIHRYHCNCQRRTSPYSRRHYCLRSSH